MAYDQAKVANDDLDDDQEMISPYDFGLMLVDWTDPSKAVQMLVPPFNDLTHRTDSYVSVLAVRRLSDLQMNQMLTLSWGYNC